MPDTFEKQLALHYPTLSDKLKLAADFVRANPVDVATRSLRAISTDAGLPPATFTRMARAIGYEKYEDLREQMRTSVGHRASTFSEGLQRLQSEHGAGDNIFAEGHLAACVRNLQEFGLSMDKAEIDRVVDRLHTSNRVVLAGALGSNGVAEYMSYMANFIADNWQLAGRSGASSGSSLVDLGPRDSLIVITKSPFASTSLFLAETAHEQGAFVVVITDTHKCPALAHASASFILPTESPHFFSSYVTTLALAETLIGMLAARAGSKARKRIAKVEEANRRLEYLRND